MLWALALAFITSCEPGSAALAPATSGPTTHPATVAPSAQATSKSTPVPSKAAPAKSAGAKAVAAAQPTWLRVASAEIDMPVSALQPTATELASQSIVPPLTEDAYWLSNYGQPGKGSQNTTYITGHTWTDRDAPFNRLSTKVKVGDPIRLSTQGGTLRYVVDSVTTHDKETLKNSDIWNIVPNRLVLISCFIQDPWGKNVVITAVPA